MALKRGKTMRRGRRRTKYGGKKHVKRASAKHGRKQKKTRNNRRLKGGSCGCASKSSKQMGGKRRASCKRTRTRKRARTRTRRSRQGCSCGMRGGFKSFSGKWNDDMVAFPPGPIYKPGVNNDAKFYGKLNMPIYPNPKSTNNGSNIRAQTAQKGGNMSSFLASNMPGFSDLRDTWWKGGEMTKDVYNQYFGYKKATNTSPGVQPIGRNRNIQRPKPVYIANDLGDGARKAAQYKI